MGEGLFKSIHPQYDYKENIQPTFGEYNYNPTNNYDYNKNCDIYPKNSTKKRSSYFRNEQDRALKSNLNINGQNDCGSPYLIQKDR